MSARSRRRRERESKWRKALADFHAAIDAMRRLREMDAEDGCRLEIILRDIAKDATPGPYVVFGDDGHAVSVMPAGRSGDVCKLDGCINPDANARWFATASPQNVIAALNTSRGDDGQRVIERLTQERDEARAAAEGYRDMILAEGFGEGDGEDELPWEWDR